MCQHETLGSAYVSRYGKFLNSPGKFEYMVCEKYFCHMAVLISVVSDFLSRLINRIVL